MNKTDGDGTRARLLQSIDLLAQVYRMGSFAAAAQALDLDPSAVSHRVRSLERLLCVALFERTTRRVQPTRAGTILCESAQRAVTDIDQALRAMRELGASASLRLSVSSSLAMKWLIPRLPEARRSGLDLSIDVREEPVALDRAEVNAGLRFGPGPYPGLHATRLASCYLQPVVGTSLAVARRANTEALHTGETTLLGDLDAEKYRTDTTWDDYFRLLGNERIASQPLEYFDRADLMLQGAIGGLGVALGRSLLIEDDIRKGLLAPVGKALRTRSSYWLVTTPELAESRGIRMLRNWLKEQIAHTVEIPR